MRRVNIWDQRFQLGQHGPEEGPHVPGVRVLHDVSAGGLGIARLEERHTDTNEILLLGERTGHSGVRAGAAVTTVQEDEQRVFPARVVVARQEDGHLRLHVLLRIHVVERGRHLGERDGERAAGRQLGRRLGCEAAIRQ